MLLAPSQAYSSRPPRSVPAVRLCSHDGGSAECDTRLVHCAGCGRTPRLCVREITGGTEEGLWYCVACQTLPACSVCHATTCNCAVTVVQSYHAAAPRALLQAVPAPSCLREPLIGLEFEAVYDRGTDQIGESFHTIDSVILSHETDSSLGVQGVETITVPLPLSLCREAWPAVVAASVAAGGSAARAVCGAHMHLSRLPDLHAAAHRVWQTYGAPAQAPVWDAVCGRPTTAYASIGWARSTTLPTHRAALWATAIGTIEWRHPGGTDDPRVLIGRAELIVDVLRHAATLPDAQQWGWGRYVRDRPRPTAETAYAFALLRSIGLYA